MLDNKTAFAIAATCLYSTGHWIGGTIMLGMTFNCVVQELRDPAGIKGLIDRLRG